VCIEEILLLFTNFYLHRKVSIFLRNDHDCKDCCFTHSLVDLMINGFDYLNWNNNGKSDPSPLILPNDFIAMNEDEYDLMTDKLMR
jgi:hypothetical protein